MTGKVSYHSGKAAEDCVADTYSSCGHTIAERRWRGEIGEIDIIAESDEGVVFIEVKKARDFVRAAERLTIAQLERIYLTASEYLGRLPKGLLTPARIDVALVDGQGRIELIENAYCP